MFDTVIVGAGPAGLAASIYAKRGGLNALLIEQNPVDGGQVLSTYEVDNYPGFYHISGLDLGAKFSEHAAMLDIDKKIMCVKRIERKDEGFVLTTDEEQIETKTVVLATGANHAKLGVSGEEELSGMGVSYCATCDGAFFKNMDVCVVGGSDVAVEDAIYLSRTCNHVYLIHRRDTFRAADSLVKALEKCDNVSTVLDSEIKEIHGEDEVTDVLIVNNKTGEASTLNVAGVFVAVGIVPSTELVRGLVEFSDKGYIVAGEDCRTGAKGIYAAGDIRKKPLRQIITAVADGANAIASVIEDLA